MGPPARSSRRPVLDRQMSSPNVVQKPTASQTLNDMAQNPSPLPGSNARTDTLTFIPTADERKSDKKSKKDKDEPESGTRKTSWGWFKGSDEKDKKDKKKEEDHKDGKKGKGKVAVDKAHDTARLDVLQATLDTGATRGRESILLDVTMPIIGFKTRGRRKAVGNPVRKTRKRRTASFRHSLVEARRRTTVILVGRKAAPCEPCPQSLHLVSSNRTLTTIGQGFLSWKKGRSTEWHISNWQILVGRCIVKFC